MTAVVEHIDALLTPLYYDVQRRIRGRELSLVIAVQRAVFWLVAYLTTTPATQLVKDAITISVIGRALAVVEDSVIRFGVCGAARRLNRLVGQSLFRTFLTLPVVRTGVKKQVDHVLTDVETKMIERGAQFPEHHRLPEKGYVPRDIQIVVQKLNELKKSSWETGRLSGAVYHGGAQLQKLQTDVFGMYTFANQLHPDCFPAVRRMDSEVVSMVLELYNAPATGCGTTTSGGTESLLLTCLAAREFARANRGLSEFEIVAPVTVHAGIDKAAHYFGMRLLHAPLDPRTMKVDLAAVKRLIGPNTVLLVGSAPNFPHGIIDDIEGLSKIALEHELPLHVDACLGSFVVPFLETIDGSSAPKFDFRVPGVTSISCDTHKYGFAPKGSSVIMYRTPELRRFQYFVSVDWTGGLYASPTLAGSRPGALVAGCWATLLYMGRKGYEESARAIVRTARKLRAGLESRPDLFYVLGDPRGSVVAFSSNKINPYDLSDELAKRGWHLSTLQNPPALHMASTELTRASVDDLVSEIISVGDELLKRGSSASSAEGTRALYGVAGSVKTSNVAERLAEGFVDCLYKA